PAKISAGGATPGLAREAARVAAATVTRRIPRVPAARRTTCRMSTRRSRGRGKEEDRAEI
ncbi:MAG: hypothetical protein ACPIOQ_24160, partial [Promethearchaeia archaeon]